MRNRFGQVISELLQEDENLYFVTADTGNAEISKNIHLYKDRFINVGIAEQNMAGIAAGLALEGKKVIVNSIGNFPTLRCLEQIRDDVAYHKLDVKFCTTGGGLSYGPAGVTHHSTEDFSIMRALPYMTCLTPGDPDEVERCTRLMIKNDGPCYMRVGYTGEPSIPKTLPIEINIGQSINYIQGHQVAIFTAGSILSEGYRAAQQLNDNGISTACFSFPTLKPIDREIIESCAKSFDYIITMEENVKSGGFGGAVSEVYSELESKKAIMKIFSLENEFPEVIGDKAYLQKVYHLTADDVVEWVMNQYK